MDFGAHCGQDEARMPKEHRAELVPAPTPGQSCAVEHRHQLRLVSPSCRRVCRRRSLRLVSPSRHRQTPGRFGARMGPADRGPRGDTAISRSLDRTSTLCRHERSRTSRLGSPEASAFLRPLQRGRCCHGRCCHRGLPSERIEIGHLGRSMPRSSSSTARSWMVNLPIRQASAGGGVKRFSSSRRSPSLRLRQRRTCGSRRTQRATPLLS